MKVGIVLDKWKLPVFRRRLSDADYTFEEKGNLTEQAVVLTVETEVPASLKTVIEQCQDECSKLKRQMQDD